MWPLDLKRPLRGSHGAGEGPSVQLQSCQEAGWVRAEWIGLTALVKLGGQ